jgi:hypothetical protein
MELVVYDTFPKDVPVVKKYRDKHGMVAAEETIFEPMLCTVDSNNIAVALIPVREIVREPVSTGSYNSHKDADCRVFRVVTNTFARKPIVTRTLYAKVYGIDNATALQHELIARNETMQYGHTVDYIVEMGK